jgi:lipopolysaccharide transport system permease protein
VPTGNAKGTSANPVGVRVITPDPPLRFVASMREIWAFRELLWQLAAREVRVRYKQTVLGAAWAILQPLSMMVVFTIFFGHFARLPSDGAPYPLFYFSALVPWAFFAGSLALATNSLTNEAGLLTKVYFPRAVVPIASLVAASLDFLVASGLLVAMLAFYRIVPGASWLLLPLLLAIQIMLTLGVGLFLSAVNVTFRDVRYAVPLLLQLWLYASPIVYPLSLIPASLRPWYVAVNPMAVLIDGYRGILLHARPPDPVLLALAAATAVGVAVGGFAYFRRAERQFADVI